MKPSFQSSPSLGNYGQSRQDNISQIKTPTHLMSQLGSPLKDVVCPRCFRLPANSLKSSYLFTTHVCFSDCTNVYWSLAHCPQQTCAEIKTTLNHKPGYNQWICCKKCLIKTSYFECPRPECKTLYFKTKGAYHHGQLINCPQCQYSERLFSCKCGCLVRKPGNFFFIEGMTCVDCPECSKPFTFVVCPNCEASNYQHEKLELYQRCKCQECFGSYLYVPCPSCGTAVKANNESDLETCKRCNISFVYNICPMGCGVNYFFVNQSLGPRRKCQGTCGSEFIVINCLSCRSAIFLESLQKGVALNQKCPNCKERIVAYYCGTCHAINPHRIDCINSTCPKPIIPKEPPAPITPVEQPVDKTCKICYVEQAIMINCACGHLMCDNCVRSVRASGTFGNQKVKCPICRTFGEYHTFIEPIYS